MDDFGPIAGLQRFAKKRLRSAFPAAARHPPMDDSGIVIQPAMC
jgi:hypothetical protein